MAAWKRLVAVEAHARLTTYERKAGTPRTARVSGSHSLCGAGPPVGSPATSRTTIALRAGYTRLHAPMDDSLQAFERGLQVRKEVLGREHVERAQARATPLDADFQRWITETAWGGVWARPNLDRRTRSLITIAILAALGRDNELKL